MRWILAAAVALAVAACGADSEPAATSGRFVALDGSPRIPDDAGVVTAIDPDFETVTIDGEQVYEVHPELQSFSSIDASTQPLRDRFGQYVHVGLEDRTVVWIAGIGSVIRLDAQPEHVLYLATVVDIDDRGHLVLRDGTVFETDVPVDPSTLPLAAVLRIAVATDRVTEIEPA